MTQTPHTPVRRVFHGKAAKNAANKTVVVLVTSIHWHAKYHKQYRTTKSYKVHDEANVTKAGDAVAFIPCRPLSKEKRWRLLPTTSA